VPHPEHRVHRYLLRGLLIDRPNQVWCADITYIPMRRGFLYLVAVMDWATREAEVALSFQPLPSYSQQYQWGSAMPMPPSFEPDDAPGRQPHDYAVRGGCCPSV
jgi:hypothetical protein